MKGRFPETLVSDSGEEQLMNTDEQIKTKKITLMLIFFFEMNDKIKRTVAIF